MIDLAFRLKIHIVQMQGVLFHIFMKRWVQKVPFYIFGGKLEKLHGHELILFFLDGVKDIRVRYESTLVLDLACLRGY